MTRVSFKKKSLAKSHPLQTRMTDIKVASSGNHTDMQGTSKDNRSTLQFQDNVIIAITMSKSLDNTHPCYAKIKECTRSNALWCTLKYE